MKFNLKLFKRLIIFFLAISFVGGIFVGTSFLKNFKYIKNPQVLNLLTYKFFLPPNLIKDIESEYNLKINSETVDSISELEEKLKDTKAKYDLVSLFSFQALQLDEEARLQPINWSLVTHLDRISSDFLNLGGDEIAKKLLPLCWGINGFAYNMQKFSTPPNSWADGITKLDSKNKMLVFDIPISVYTLSQEYDQLTLKTKRSAPEKNLKNLLTHFMNIAQIYHVGEPLPDNFNDFGLIEMMSVQMTSSLLKNRSGAENYKFVLPQEGALFWTLNLAEPRFAAHPKEIAIFLNAILAEKNALSILQFNHLSTTYKNLEGAQVEPELKAEYIRQIPLTSLKFQNNFPDSGIFSQLMNGVAK